jgi:hypothetical protein
MIYNVAVAVRDGLPVLFLAVLNMFLSGVVGLVLVWWYKNEDLPEEKLWYLLILGMLILFQSVTADVFVGHVQTKAASKPGPAPSTPAGYSKPKTLAPPTHHTTKPDFFKAPRLETG